jgi:murein DD-endopeptidase MepM/ murein hydrolase activator NlpD
MFSKEPSNFTSGTKNPLFSKRFLVIFGCLAIALPATTQALSFNKIIESIGDTLGIVKAEEKGNNNKEENIQNLRVFEPDKNIKAATLPDQLPKKSLNNEEDLSLEAGQDNFYAGENLEKEDENMHSDNAIYKVQRGESIYSIAAYFSISADTILSFNKITEKEIRPGTVLEIPPVDGVYYEVKKGDTLRKLADKYKVELDDITLFNGLLENENLAVGDEVFIPGAKPEKKEEQKTPAKNSNLANGKTKTQTVIDPMLGNLSKYIKYLGKGSTAQKSKLSDLKKYASLPKYPGYYIMPAPGTSRTQTVHGHNGSDFAGKIGTPVLAAAGGTVRVAKSSGYNFGYGNYIIITHANGSETVYAHLSRVLVSQGQTVGQGAQIGAIGSSGNSTGPHLHFEIRGAYNPWAW